MTKEHIPPEKAFNNQSYLKHHANETEKSRRINWEITEENTKGVYIFTLCEDCNNKTGRWYGRDYAEFVEAFISKATPENANKILEVEIKNFFPLRVIKQVISMILSTSNPTSFKGYSMVSSPKNKPSSIEDIEINNPDKSYQLKVYQQLRDFVKKRDATGLPANIKLYAFACIGHVGFRTGIFSTISLDSKKVAFAVVTGMHPILWILVLDGDIDQRLLDVTDWAKFGYKQKKTLQIEMPCYWLLGKYPLDFRSPLELYLDDFVNSMIQEGLVFTSDLSKEQELEEAIYFAKVLGKISEEGYLISKFESGVFYEFNDINGWLENGTIEQAKQVIKWRLQQEK